MDTTEHETQLPAASELDGLAAAAEQLCDGPPAKRQKGGPRGDKVKQAERRVQKARLDMDTLQAIIDAAVIEGGTAKRKVEKLSRDRNKLSTLKAELLAAEKNLADAKQAAAVRAEAEQPRCTQRRTGT